MLFALQHNQTNNPQKTKPNYAEIVRYLIKFCGWFSSLSQCNFEELTLHRGYQHKSMEQKMYEITNQQAEMIKLDQMV